MKTKKDPSGSEVNQITINDFGGSPFCTHNYPCPIYHNKKAVRIIGSGYFQPSWDAQKDGYKIIKASNLIQKFAVKYLFKTDFEIIIKE